MKKIILLAAAALLVSLPATAQDLGIGIRAGTTGFGVEVGYGLNSKINVRGHFSAFSYTRTDNGSEDPELTIDTDAGIGAFTAFVDFHPFENSFRLTGGLGKNNFDVSATATPIESVCFGDEDNAGNCDGKVLTPQKLGDFSASAKYPSSVHPYMGIGFGSLGWGQSRVTFLFDLGVYYTGAPELTLKNQGLFEPTTTKENVQPINDGLDSFRWYPVLSLGLGIRL